jgi:hypothetical protein
MPDSSLGTVLAVLVGRAARSLVSTPQAQVNVTFEGFEGDLHAGFTRPSDGRKPFYPRGTLVRNDRQVSLVSSEELAQVAAALGLPDIRPEWLGANLLTAGLPALTLLPAGTRLFFGGGAVLLVSGENLPCSGPGRVLQGLFPASAAAKEFPRAALHKRGLVAVVERPGIIQVGERVSLAPG